MRTNHVLESLRSAVNCRVHVGRVLDTRLKTSGSEVPGSYISLKYLREIKGEKLPVQLPLQVRHFRHCFLPEPGLEVSFWRRRDPSL